MRTADYTIVVLISGNGSNLQAIIDAHLPVRIALVVSDVETAFGLARAKQAGIATATLNPRNYASREAFDLALMTLITAENPNLVVLAGFMRILSPAFVRHFAGKLINIHPSLLPAYKGLHTHQRVLAANELQHGATVHAVTEALDEGPIIAQVQFPVHANDTVISLKQRVQTIEHQLYPAVIRGFAEQKLQCREDGVYFLGEKVSVTGVMMNRLVG